MEKAQRLTPRFVEKLWGRKQLRPWFADSQKPVGEVWYTASPEIPILVKLLFTTERLSVQVHPDDGEDGPQGKTEMWHILEADPGATIALGFREPVSAERLRDSTRTGEIEQLLNWMPVAAGETYFTPAHTVHAIGAGIVLCEIQQNSDVTYRLWDYGRPRELHIEKALPMSDRTVHPGPSVPRDIVDGREELVRGKHFITESVRLAPRVRHIPANEPCQLWICLEGEGEIGGERFGRSDVWLLPETGMQPCLQTATGAHFLRTYLPR